MTAFLQFAKEKLSSYKLVLKNTFYLSLIEVVHLLMPFIALPYIIKTVGAANYGKIAFAQAVVMYFWYLVNFGLDIPAAKLVSRNRESGLRLRVIVGAVLVLKLFTLCVSFILFSGLVFLWPQARNDLPLFYSAFLICLTDVFFVLYFFQGLEKMFVITIIKGCSMLLYVVLLFIFLHKREQYWLVPLLQSGSLLLTSFYGFYYMCKKEKVIPLVPSMVFMRKLFKESFSFFLSRISVILNNSFATLIIGIVMNDYSVAVYDLAVKISRAALIPISMLTQAIFPHNARYRDRKFAMRAFAGLLGTASFGIVVLYFLAPFLVHFLGDGQLPEAVPLLRLLEIQILLCAFTYYLGSPLLVAWGYPKPFNHSVLIATGCLLLTYGIFYFFSLSSVYWFALAVILSELIILIYRAFYCVKYKIIGFQE